ncbi:MAG: hypothetical protein ABIN91_19295 [Mucilaginibacter sp.]|uniref:hypothetical protein n=1 Tax=Mucilaginibacter sp. TaxID=1882438 RepID=UPI003267EC5B
MTGVFIFYNQAEWHILINNVIRPIFFDLQNDKVLNRYYLFFGKRKGDHIKIVVEDCDSHSLESVYDRLEKFIKAYPSVNKTTRYPLEALFKNFPNNSIIKYTQLVSNVTNDLSSFRCRISEILVQALCEEVFSLEVLFTFLIYIQLTILRLNFNNFYDAKPAMNEIVKRINFNKNIEYKKENIIHVAHLFEGNVETLKEIVDEIWNDRNVNQHGWLKEWETNCNSFLEGDKPFVDTFILIMAVCCEHLDITLESYVPESLLLLLDL